MARAIRPETAMTMPRRAALAETVSLRWNCIGPSSRPVKRLPAGRVIRRQPRGMSLDTIRLLRAASLTVHLHRRALSRISHMTAAADRDHHPTATVVRHRTVVVAAIVTRNHQTTDASGNLTPPLDGWVDTNRKSDGKPTVALSAFKDETDPFYQTPLSLPVILNATAAADASGGNKLSRNVAGTLPLKAACVIC